MPKLKFGVDSMFVYTESNVTLHVKSNTIRLIV